MAATASDKKSDIKVIIVGDASVGKTALMLRFDSGKFVEGTQPTLPMGFCVKDHKGVTLSIWDTAGTEKFMSCSKFYARNAKVALIVFDITERDSFEKVTKYWDMVRDEAADDCYQILVANKIDLVENNEKKQAVTLEEMHALATARKAKKTFVTSAKTGRNVMEVFDDLASAIHPEKFNRMSSGQLSPMSPVSPPPGSPGSTSIVLGTAPASKEAQKPPQKADCCA